MGTVMSHAQTTARVSDICADCAKRAGGVWPAGHVATVSMGDCDVCERREAVCSPGDWNWPVGRPRNWMGWRD